jgi:hypothetical protein
MKVKRYKGTLKNLEGFYFTDVNLDFDISKIKDEAGKDYEFIEYVNYKGEIKQWNPFQAKFKGYSGDDKSVIFKCPVCKSNNCQRVNHNKLSDPYFFQGEFKCSDCGQSNFNYYSDCFIFSVQQVNQTSLFPELMQSKAN